MARSVFVAVCLLLVAIWIHPYMSGAFETHARIPHGLGAEVATASAVASNVENSPLTVIKGTQGFWRLGKSETGVWWFISPDGNREFMNTVTTVQPFQLGREKQGLHFVSRDWNGTAGKYDGDLHTWADKTIARVHDAGFKGLGAWCHPEFQRHDIPMSRDLTIWKYGGVAGKLFSPDWIKDADEIIAKTVTALKDNRNLMGYFTDNELDWSDATVGPGVYFDGLPIGDPNRAEVLKSIQSIWPTVDDYNTAWGARLQSWADLESQPKLPREPEAAYARLFSSWLEKLATHYFRVTSMLVRKHDPNHLVLGVRFAGFAPREVVRASREYTDAQSLNYYVSDGQIDPDMFKMMAEESGQPIIISEYSFNALDGRSGNRNTCGFQGQVPDQEARAKAYALYTSRLARLPYVIGADWFQWSDEPPSGRDSDGEDVNFGVVDVDDKPYKSLTDSIRKTTPLLNGMHAQSPTDSHEGVFRNTFATKPVQHVMKLERPLSINAELSDWSETYRINGIHQSETIGTEGTKTRQPNIFMGWRDEGLYMAAEVFTSYIETVPAEGRWWTRDNVEFWVSTRPVPAEQQVYNSYCHQFFFVPEFNVATGKLGTVGQWHRPGDAIAANLVPQTQIQQSTRLLPGRYVVEMFIPANALHGWDPHGHPQLAFNIHIRSFQMALDYFWSAPKEMSTQTRPDTWGTIVLTAPQVAIAR